MATFESSARTVDMLGRQQIAGVSTALSEVFKNAHDAYANRVQVDLLPESSAALIRDDGVGMNREAFVDRWLTLAASKESAGLLAAQPAGHRPRPTLGAKGIGRLAIASVGPHVLILTKSTNHDLVVAFVNWTAFEHAGLNLSEIEIPIRTFDSGWPTVSDISSLVQQSRANLRKVLERRRSFPKKDNDQAIEDAMASMDRFNTEAFHALTNTDGPVLSSESSGTAFMISPLGDEIAEDLARHAPEELELATELLGFNNTAVPGTDKPRIKTALIVHGDQFRTDVLDSTSFVTAEDFASCDHTVSGQFDETGQFTGMVSIYGKARQSYSVRWRDPTGRSIARQPRCGPFSFDLAVIQGSARESKLDSVDHKILTERLSRLGGVYVYNHGIRVLPYGRPDVDWLDIEQRRSKSLSKAYFSHRRMFGAVTISTDGASGLIEKAGREGFQKNAAFRDLQTVLQQFLETLAADYFVRGGDHSSPWWDGKDTLRAAADKAKKREAAKKELARARSNFQEQVAARYVELRDGLAELSLGAIVSDLESSIAEIKQGESAESLEVVVARSTGRLLDLTDAFQVELPPGIGSTNEIKRDLATLRSEYASFDTNMVLPARRKMHELATILSPSVMTEESLLTTLRPSEVRGRKALESEIGKLHQSLDDLGQRFNELTKEVTRFTTDGIDAVRADVAEASPSESVDGYVQIQAGFEAQLNELFDQAVGVLTGFRAGVESVAWERLGSGFWTSTSERDQDQLEIESLGESITRSADLVLQGMTLAIVDHEFNLVVRGLRRSLDEVKAWAQLNAELQPSVGRVVASFEQLDSFLGVFAPLRRPARRRKELITGRDLKRFLNSIFFDRAENGETDLEYTDAFLENRFSGHRSVWYPVLVNLVDNAMYWVQEAEGERTVVLDLKDGEILVSDTGPGVRDDDHAMIWESRFSRKPGGSGLGLTISREALGDEGFTLDLVTSSRAGATFAIQPLTEESAR